jgi:hypothetical protein
VSLSAQQQRVLNLIDEKELVELTVAMSSITAPSGYEQPMDVCAGGDGSLRDRGLTAALESEAN